MFINTVIPTGSSTKRKPVSAIQAESGPQRQVRACIAVPPCGVVFPIVSDRAHRLPRHDGSPPLD